MARRSWQQRKARWAEQARQAEHPNGIRRTEPEEPRVVPKHVKRAIRTLWNEPRATLDLVREAQRIAQEERSKPI